MVLESLRNEICGVGAKCLSEVATHEDSGVSKAYCLPFSWSEITNLANSLISSFFFILKANAKINLCERWDWQHGCMAVGCSLL